MGKKLNIGIIGGAGYTAGELIRILIFHPNVSIKFVHSTSNADKYIYGVHTDMLGDCDLKFSSTIDQDIDVLYLCLGHGDSVKFLEQNDINKDIRIIDLSQDFRVDAAFKKQNRNFIYGLPELNNTSIKTAENIANPGCFATSIQLALLPLAAKKLLNEDVHISAITGSTGAGQALKPETHFTWRYSNMSTYKAFEHQHLNEITHSVLQLQPSFKKNIHFIPYRGNFTRGIMASVYTPYKGTEKDAIELYQNYYKDSSFTHVSTNKIDLKQVVNTNKGIVHLQKHGDQLLITSIIDNLLKGASGQAVQNMNLMCGLDEKTGLNLKASAF
ncbi:MAG: N-acetyl-gamma-glutamyl-phosphate reductase [Bacteroidetes bacterium]|nr:N-acetyl-gamma-glutamyl-phosphate reductase [Bacteroidota bacterium]